MSETIQLYDTQGRRLYLASAERDAFLEAAMKADRPIRTLCSVLHYTGCRVSEALALIPYRVDINDQTIIFETLKKRRRGVYRAVPVPQSLMDTLDMVHGLREAHRRQKKDRLDAQLWPCSRVTAWRQVCAVMIAAAILDGPHRCPKGVRHGFAIHALSKGVPLNMVSKWMGHAKMETTAIYCNAVGEEQQSIAARMWGCEGHRDRRQSKASFFVPYGPFNSSGNYRNAPDRVAMAKPARDLEILVAKIQQQLAPDTDVLHDVKLNGRASKRPRQIDVLVRHRIGQYTMQIIIDCKDYARPVDMKSVEEFYGLMIDVGAQKGVLVCPSGFSKAAKNRAEGLQRDLYSPVDTDPHKWQAQPLIPTLCDFRSARMSFAFAATAPLPFMLPRDFYASNMVFVAQGNELGTMLATAMKKWNDGCFPTDVDVHDTLPIFDAAEVLTDNGYGMRAPIHLSVSLDVERTLYYGMFPIQWMSGFKDELRGGVITNAFTVG